MKKSLLGFAFACLVCATGTNAQVIITQNFDAPTVMPALPSTWTQNSTGAVGWKTSTFPIAGWGAATGTTEPAHATQVGVVDDWNDAATSSNLHDTLKSPVFSLAGSTSAWLNYEYYFYNATRTSTSNTETSYVIGSNDGGTTWMMLDTLEGWAFNETWHTGHTSLSPLGTGTNIKVAFTYSDDLDTLIGVVLDNIEVTNLNTNGAAVTQLGYNSIANGVSANGQTVSFLMENRGLPITSFTAKYTINGGAPVTQNFTGLSIAPYGSAAYTFTTAMAGAVAGSNTLKVVITDVNTVPNAEADSLETSTFVLASATTQRQGLIEEFSSSTCPPCKSFNQNYDPLCETNGVNTAGSNINVIKYQMNWPSPGNDRSYNPDGSTRRGYYGVSGIPDHFVNGQPAQIPATLSTFNAANHTAEMNASKANAAFMEMSVTYNVDTIRKKLGVLLTVTPRFTKTGTYHVYTAVVDKYYENTTNTTGQLKYYHVMRKMLPSASGHAVTSWTDGVAQSFVDSGIAYTSDRWETGSANYPTQGSYKFWNNPLLRSEVIAWVQEDASKSVLQSIWSLPAGMVNVSTLAKVENISLYPNPSKGESNLKFDLQETGNVRVAVMDYTGKVIKEVANQDMSLGMQQVNISTKGMTPGNYIILISTESGNRAERLTVE